MRQILIPIGSTLKSQLYITMGRLLVDLKRILLFNKKSQPRIIIEVGYEEIQKSLIYDSGFALRFPKVLQLRIDKPVSEISTLNLAKKIYKNQKGKK